MIRNFILIGAFATLALSCKQKLEKSENDITSENEKILNNISYDVKEGYTKDGLSVADAEDMVKNYKGHAGKDPIDLKKQNTRSVWFNLDTLDNLVKQLKAERLARQKGNPAKRDSVTDGVRLYFGRYKTHIQSNMKERNTLIFVSTYWVQKGNFHQDYFNKLLKRSDPLNNGELSPPNTLGVSWDSEVN